MDPDRAKINRGVGIIKRFCNANEGAIDVLPKALEQVGIDPKVGLDDLGSAATYEQVRAIHTAIKKLAKGD